MLCRCKIDQYAIKLANIFVDWSDFDNRFDYCNLAGEQISEKGYGNGTSMIIFAGIISSLPGTFHEIYIDRFVNIESSRLGNQQSLLLHSSY